MKRYLTKSRYKLSLECPTKLFYTKKEDYIDQKKIDDFLLALCEGGLQVGELAKKYYSNGHDIKTLDYEESLNQTKELLKKDSVVIFEAAFKYENCFIRVDILEKKGNKIELIEVKSKSSESKDIIKGEKNPYLCDLAFQKYVLSKAYPQFEIKSYFLLLDKEKPCPSNELFRKFKIKKDENKRSFIEVLEELTEEERNNPILSKIDLDTKIDSLIRGKGMIYKDKSFEEEIKFLSKMYELDEKIFSEEGRKCKKCEFKCTTEKEALKFKSGFKECWSHSLNWNEDDFKEANIFNLSGLEVNYRKIDSIFKQAKKLANPELLKLKNLEKEIFEDKKIYEGFTPSEKIIIQIDKEKLGYRNPEIHTDLKKEMDSWKFPLHFIDFETSKPAIPFTKGKKPYEEIAFQFSHHIVYEDGRIEHKTEYIDTELSYFPNFDFLRSLKKALGNDEGSVFRYWDHEKTYLKKIHKQLSDSNEADKIDLMNFIESLVSLENNEEKKERMIDLGKDVVMRYFANLTKGSYSIKKVLPAVLNQSEFLKKKYSEKIYGTDKIKSLNFREKKWIEFDEKNEVIDPYNLLGEKPDFLKDYDDETFSRLDEKIEQDGNIQSGGEAMMAYHYLQSSDISTDERKRTEKALLKYCELDTFAMVMIYEYCKECVDKINNQ